MTVDFQQLRVKMVDGQLRTTDVTDLTILTAMLNLPREEFVPRHRQALAYIDEDIELKGDTEAGGARYLMEPSPFAKLVQLAAIRPEDKVLDVGCATGYSCAVLSSLAKTVIGLESDAALAGLARELVAKHASSGVEIVEGPLKAGHAPQAPYDVILINGAVDEVPDALFEQLAEGGRLVAVVGSGNAGKAMLYVKDNGLVSVRQVFNAAIRPLDEFRRTPEFEF